MIDADAITEAVFSGDGELSETEQILLLMREAWGEVAVLDAAGNPLRA